MLVLKKLGDDLLPQLMEALRHLRREGLRCVVERDVYDRLSLEDGFGFVETFLPGDPLAEAVDFCVCLGGDGVILHASTLFGSGPAPPIISFNLGSLGFLTNHTFDCFQQDVHQLMYGDGPMDGAYSCCNDECLWLATAALACFADAAALLCAQGCTSRCACVCGAS